MRYHNNDLTEHVNNVLEQHKKGCDLCFCNTDEILDNEFTEDIQEVIKGLKNNKRPGQDRIPQIFQQGSTRPPKETFFLQIFNLGQLPESWFKSVIIPLFKT